jgi:hypothetical protein
MTNSTLPDGVPSSIQYGHTQTQFYFGGEPGRLGEQADGAVFGIVTLTSEHAHYARFRVYRGRVGNGYVKLDERPLTAEEIRRFQSLLDS